MLDTLSCVHEIERLMTPYLDGEQLRQLHAVLDHCLVEPSDFASPKAAPKTNDELLEAFLAAKRLEGCSERTIGYYASVLKAFTRETAVPFTRVGTDDIRQYLTDYRANGHAGSVTTDNVRRVISSLFSWLECENFIYKSPVRRIKKIRSTKSVKPVISDEGLEHLRDGCGNARDLALVDMLASTGMRVGELVKLDRDDIDFEGRECVVHGKGGKERRVYFDARTKVHLAGYLHGRDDDNPALFVALGSPHERLQISGVETRLRKLGAQLNLTRIHPHKFRRTLATRAIDKGMPIEQVQLLLGHSKIDTTLGYAMVDQENVRLAHRKFIG